MSNYHLNEVLKTRPLGLEKVVFGKELIRLANELELKVQTDERLRSLVLRRDGAESQVMELSWQNYTHDGALILAMLEFMVECQTAQKAGAEEERAELKAAIADLVPQLENLREALNQQQPMVEESQAAVRESEEDEWAHLPESFQEKLAELRRRARAIGGDVYCADKAFYYRRNPRWPNKTALKPHASHQDSAFRFVQFSNALERMEQFIAHDEDSISRKK